MHVSIYKLYYTQTISDDSIYDIPMYRNAIAAIPKYIYYFICCFIRRSLTRHEKLSTTNLQRRQVAAAMPSLLYMRDVLDSLGVIT